MPTTVVLLVLGSAFLHALWNAMLKGARHPERAVVGVLAASAVTSIVINVVLAVPVPGGRALAYSVAAGVLEAGYFVTLARALSRGSLGPVYTIVRGGALVVVWPVAILVLGEQVTPVTLGGSVLVVAGLVATGAADGLRGAISPERLGWAVVCAGFVGSYHLAYKLALAAGASPAFVNASLVVASVVNLATIGGERRRGAWEALREEPVRIVLAGVIASGGFVVFLTALAHAGAGVVLTLRNTSILFAQIFSALQGARPRRLGVVGAVLVTAGAALLAR